MQKLFDNHRYWYLIKYYRVASLGHRSLQSCRISTGLLVTKARVALERNQIFCNFWWGKNWPKFCKFQILAAVASNLNVLTKTLLIDTYVNHKPIWLLYLRSKEIVPSLRRQMILSQTLPVRAASIQNYTQGTVHRGSDRSPAHIPHLTLNNYRKSQMDRVKSYFVPPLRLPN